ncbi:hypothetical protein L211DRAFT_779303 [Terfezia boudieri ATCC MYA-4762]|uniref:DUF803-domain-containing protein n=1 Tax=Terfezia boudieri ATCC MYA-4762 TaxID=1051890 RepID=A0A3N4LXI8_9PEZI|nr:hypothetical protein L211DRAFT_779303 [Terfezia boudieri ATCC MYA-4762]
MRGFDNVSPTVQISIGVLVGILSTSVQSLGLTLQRKSHLLEDDRPAHLHRRPPHRRRMWQIGMLLFIISNILGSTVQITTLPLVLLSPLQSSGLVFNSICATLILAEPFTRLSFIGTVLVCIGATLIAAFGAMKEPTHSLDELLGLLSGMPFLLWMGGQALVVAGILIAARLSSMLRPKLKHTPKMRMIRGVAYGCVSGVLSADTLLLAKSAVELLVRTIIDRINQFNRWQSWMILVGLVVLAITQLYYLHRGLKLCSTSVLYPLVFCVYNIIAILDGLIYYKQASRLSALSGGLIALGTIILLTGVLALSWRLSEESPPGGPQQTTQSILTPNLGLLEQHDEAELETGAAEDENAESGDETTATESTSLLRRPGPRRRAMTEVEEIWGELEDDSNAGRKLISGPSTPLEGSRRPSASEGVRRFSFRRSSRGGAVGEGEELQEAIGGWWPMKWWGKGHSGSRERGDRGGGGVVVVVQCRCSFYVYVLLFCDFIYLMALDSYLNF